jgi:hypothetical protein
MRLTHLTVVVFTSVLHGQPALGQLRVAEWNVTNYSSGRVADFQTSIYGQFQGRSMSPDILICQEFLSAAGVTNFLNILNTASGGPGDWAAAPFLDGPDTDNAFFYRTSKVDFLGVTTVSVGGLSPQPPRNTERYDIRLKGYDSDGAILSCYSSHMKSGTASDDQSRRLVEAQRIRDNAEGLNPTRSFLLAGDFNIQSSSQLAYVELVGSQANDAGRFFDPINTPGSWNNNAGFRFVHTQDPAGSGGMDDRHDQVLLCAKLVDGAGFDYSGNPLIPYSTTTWEDPNHSYRSWGNDGTSFDAALKINGNLMVGATIAQALFNSASGQGHLPVFLDFLVPPKVDCPPALDFGPVPQGAAAELALSVANTGDVGLWTAGGIAALRYTLLASAGFAAPAGLFSASAGSAANQHIVSMDTSTVGPKLGTLTIASNAPDTPSCTVMLSGEVVSGICDGANANCDLQVDLEDVGPFVDVLLGNISPCSTCAADVDDNGARDGRDVALFVHRLAP